MANKLTEALTRKMSRTYLDSFSREAQDFVLALMAARYDVQVDRVEGMDRDGPYVSYVVTGVEIEE